MEEEHYRKLWRNIILSIFIYSVIPLLVLGIVIYHQFSVSYTAKIKDSMKTLVENRCSSLDLFFDERVSQLLSLANTSPVEQLKKEDYLNRVFTIIQARSKSFLDLGLIGEEGKHVSYVGPHYNIVMNVNYKNEEWFHAVLSTGIYISDVFMGFRKFPHFIIAVLIREKNQSWILRATIDTEIIDNIVRAAWIGKRGDAFIINQNNILQTSPRFSGALLGQPETPNFSAATGTLIEEIPVKGEETLFAAGTIKNKKWVMAVREDPKEQLTPLLQARFIGVLIFLGGILVIIIGAFFSTRAMMNHLMEVERQKALSDEMVMHQNKMAALGKMAAGIAHEINNPLAVIGEKAGWIKDLLKDEEDSSRKRNLPELLETVSKIEYHINRAKTVTHRLLGFARRIEPVTEKVDVNILLNETIEFLGNEARFRNIEIKKYYGPDQPLITSDSSQLQQVFLNILNNAIDAIGKDGEISVTTTRIEGSNEIAIAISDNGPGIPKEIVTKIFEPFFTTKEVGKGTGLGMSIAYSIIEKLHGRMLVASEEGQGTTFTIYLPIK